MFCFQCEQTRDNKGCQTTGSAGVCGKTPECATLQDLTMHALKTVGWYGSRLAPMGSNLAVINEAREPLFATVTNVNFDSNRFVKYLSNLQDLTVKLDKEYKSLGGKESPPAEFTNFDFKNKTIEQLEEQGQKVGIRARKASFGNDDLVGLYELITYGLKGTIAYADHAADLGQQDAKLNQGLLETFSLLTEKPDAGKLLAGALRVGELNITAMEILERGHITQFGTPSPATVTTHGKKGKAILVSGHDIPDVLDLLKATKDKGINVYTHGELLPAHAYPKLREFPNFAGHYGGPWQIQKFDFSNFPGAIVMTSNCLIEPMTSYRKRIFTRRAVGWPGITHIENHDWSPVIKAALEEDGFEEDEKATTPLTVGYHKDTILGAAPKVLELIKGGQLKDFFVIGGCDGSEGERSYFRDVAQMSDPNSSLILTMGCGKYRFNKLPLGTLAGLPRVLDMGQCNDAYGAVQVALTLAKALNTDINSLPIHYAISWFEQKAVAVLLSLLHLGVQKIYLGPNLPAFVTPNMLKILVEKYNIRGTGDVKKDFAQMMAK